MNDKNGKEIIDMKHFLLYNDGVMLKFLSILTLTLALVLPSIDTAKAQQPIDPCTETLEQFTNYQLEKKFYEFYDAYNQQETADLLGVMVRAIKDKDLLKVQGGEQWMQNQLDQALPYIERHISSAKESVILDHKISQRMHWLISDPEVFPCDFAAIEIPYIFFKVIKDKERDSI